MLISEMLSVSARVFVLSQTFQSRDLFTDKKAYFLLKRQSSSLFSFVPRRESMLLKDIEQFYETEIKPMPQDIQSYITLTYN